MNISYRIFPSRRQMKKMMAPRAGASRLPGAFTSPAARSPVSLPRRRGRSRFSSPRPSCRGFGDCVISESTPCLFSLQLSPSRPLPLRLSLQLCPLPLHPLFEFLPKACSLAFRPPEECLLRHCQSLRRFGQQPFITFRGRSPGKVLLRRLCHGWLRWMNF
jgi:hypothetical protein